MIILYRKFTKMSEKVAAAAELLALNPEEERTFKEKIREAKNKKKSGKVHILTCFSQQEPQFNPLTFVYILF